jgi:hypothetical protein
MAYQEFEAAATGLASRPPWPGAQAHLDRMRALLAQDGVQALLSDRLAIAQRLMAALEQRHSASRGWLEQKRPLRVGQCRAAKPQPGDAR